MDRPSPEALISPHDQMLLTVVGNLVKSELAALRSEMLERIAVESLRFSASQTRIADLALDVAQAVQRAEALDLMLDDRVEERMAQHAEQLARDLEATIRDGLEPRLMDIERRAVLTAQAAMPAPRDGKDGRDGRDGKDGRDGVDGTHGEAGADGHFTEPRAWAGSARKGELVVHRHGLFYVLRDTQAEPGVLSSDWQLVVNGMHDVSMEPVAANEVRVAVEMTSGERVTHELHLPGFVYRGVWAAGNYRAGECVTHTGSLWVAERATDVRPGEAGQDTGWRLSAKKGADGRHGTSIEWAGDWSAGKSYRRGQVVRAPSGNVFICTESTEKIAPPARMDRNDAWQAVIRSDLDDGR